MRRSVVLPAPFGPIRPVNSPGCTVSETSRKTSRPPSLTPTPSSPEQVGAHRCSLETPLVTAFCRARTSASIQDW